MDKTKNNVLAAQQDAVLAISSVMAERQRHQARGLSKHSVLLNRGAPVTNPAGFWGDALASKDSNPKEAAAAIKLAAANLQLGNIDFVMESSVGQVGWLSAMALELKADADALPPNSGGRVRLLALALRCQGAAAKLILSLGALVKLGNDSTAVIDNPD